MEIASPARRESFLHRITHLRRKKETGFDSSFQRKLSDSFELVYAELNYTDIPIRLHDGTIVKPYSPFGRIKFTPLKKAGERHAQYTKRAHEEAEDGLKKLAKLCLEDPALQSVQVFGDVSRLAPSAEKYGFESRAIDTDHIERALMLSQINTYVSLNGASVPGGMKSIPSYSLISRKTLLERYAPQEPPVNSSQPESVPVPR